MVRKTTSTPHAISAVALAKIVTSGLDEEQAQALGFYSVDDASTLHKSFAPIAALVLPYYEGPTDNPYYRIRYLEEFPRSFTTKERGKYSQPPDTGVKAYLPRTMPWSTIRDNTDEDLLITEGELKAAAACSRDFACIGLGGVYSFKNKDTEFLPELEAFAWKGRRTVIAYDSDAATNPHVAVATQRLVDLLRARGASVRVLRLPPSPSGAKVGLDDYLLDHTDDDLIDLANMADEGYPPELLRFNEEIAYVHMLDRIVEIDNPNGPLMTPTTFTSSSRWATRTYRIPLPKKDTFGDAPVAPAWLKWPVRHEVEALTYEPGEPQLTPKGLNRWPDWGCVAQPGVIKPWLDLIDFVFSGAEPEHLEWFFDWCAYPIQHPGTKLYQAVVVHGVTEGTGKSFVGYILGDIYGENFSVIGDSDLKSPFNQWARYRQFVMGEEISGGDKRQDSDRLKAMLTQERVMINVKHQPTYTVKDCINYYFTSNHPDAFFMTDKARRFFIHEVPHSTPLPDASYRRMDLWRANGGGSHLRHWLETRDINPEFNPHGPAPRTRALEAMVRDSASELGLWCLNLKSDPDTILTFGGLKHRRDMFAVSELLDMYWRSNDPNRKVTLNGMNRALKSVGFRQVYGGNQVRIGDTRQRYFAIRNASKWLNPSARYKIENWLRQNIELTPVKDK